MFIALQKETVNSTTVNNFKFYGWMKTDDRPDNIQSFLEFLIQVQHHSVEGPIVVLDRKVVFII